MLDLIFITPTSSDIKTNQSVKGLLLKLNPSFRITKELIQTLHRSKRKMISTSDQAPLDTMTISRLLKTLWD
jgi:hypothetical protein